MIRFITRHDFPQIMRSWQTCFGDGEAYIRLFWNACFPLCRGLTDERDGTLTAMAFLLPGALVYREESYPATYIYAVATLPEYRGRGIAAALMQRAAEIAREEGQAALCLLPGSEGLYDYYAKLGYSVGFARQVFELPAGAISTDETPAHNRQPAFDSTLAANHRNSCWNTLGYFAWAPPLLNYMAKEHFFRGGEILLEDSGYAFVEGTHVRERCVSVPTNQPGGMILPLNQHGENWLAQTARRGYLGLTLE